MAGEEIKVQERPATLAKREERGLWRWDPFEALDELQEEIDRLWRRAWWPAPWSLTRPLRRLTRMAETWAPRCDVYEQNGQIVVKAELPGVKKEDIEVSLVEGDLVIRGERKAESEVKEEDYYRMERSYGSFYRRLALPADVKADEIQARYQDGVLEVRIPKPSTKKIPIKVS